MSLCKHATPRGFHSAEQGPDNTDHHSSVCPCLLLQVKKDGLDVLQGWEQLKKFYDHMTLNFVGAITTLMALQVGEGEEGRQGWGTPALVPVVWAGGGEARGRGGGAQEGTFRHWVSVVVCSHLLQTAMCRMLVVCVLPTPI